MSKAQRNGGIDYSKWDHFGDSDSEQEQEQEQPLNVHPRVTRLASPSRITMIPQSSISDNDNDGETAQRGALLIETEASESDKQQKLQQIAQSILETSYKSSESNCERSSTRESIANVNVDRHSKTETSATTVAAAATRETEVSKSWTTNGAHVHVPEYNLYWTQDRTTVSLRFQLPQDAISKTISVQWKGMIYSYKDRHMAVGSNNTASFQILCDTPTTGSTHGQIILVHGELPHPIHYNEYRDDDDDELDWEIDHDEHGRRYVLLALPKAVPMAGMTIRWKRPMLQVPLVDDHGEHDGSTATPFQKAWDEAHTLFREKIARGEIPKRS